MFLDTFNVYGGFYSFTTFIRLFTVTRNNYNGNVFTYKGGLFISRNGHLYLRNFVCNKGGHHLHFWTRVRGSMGLRNGVNGSWGRGGTRYRPFFVRFGHFLSFGTFYFFVTFRLWGPYLGWQLFQRTCHDQTHPRGTAQHFRTFWAV